MEKSAKEHKQGSNVSGLAIPLGKVPCSCCTFCQLPSVLPDPSFSTSPRGNAYLLRVWKGTFGLRQELECSVSSINKWKITSHFTDFSFPFNVLQASEYFQHSYHSFFPSYLRQTERETDRQKDKEMTMFFINESSPKETTMISVTMSLLITFA